MKWNRKGLLHALQEEFGELTRITDSANSTSENYAVDGHKGHIGIIAAWSRTFCGTCNRVRLTPSGHIKTCLYGKNELDLRKELRAGLSDEDIAQKIENAVRHKAIDGNIAEQQRSRVEESMATIGG